MERFDPASAGIPQAGYRFGELRLEADGTLLRAGAPVPLPPRELAALRLLLARQGQVISAAELKLALWGNEPAAAESVSNCLASLRKRLEPEDCIQILPKRGYRFSAEAKPMGSEPAAALPRLAILPFATGYGIPEYQGVALAEEACAQLGGFQPAAVSVLARDSAFALARRGIAPQQIGAMLNANLVLTGELRAVQSHYRLRAQMIRVEDGAQVWAEDRLVEWTRLAGLEKVLVDLVSFRMHGPGTAGRGASICASAASTEEREQTPQQGEAYEIFARARYEWQSLERHRMQDALQHLLRATELDPNLIAARVSVAYLCVTQAFYGFMAPAVAANLVRQAAGPVPDLPARAESILPALGWVSFHVERNLPAALRSFARSAHLPHDPWITRTRTTFALNRHRFGEAIELLEAAIRVDPWSAWLQARLAWSHHLAGSASASMQLAQAALERFPEHEEALLYGAIILAWNGEPSWAVDLAQRLTQRMPYFDPAAAVHAYALAVAGRTGEARTVLEGLHWLGQERYAIKTFAPAAYVALGELDTALAELRAAEESRCPWFFQMLADPRLKPLHGRAEFDSMLGILTEMNAEAERASIAETAEDGAP